MVTGEIKGQIDQIWNAFWSGGVSNPLSVIEQITYLLFIKRLDELHTMEESKSNRLKKPMERRYFPEGEDELGLPAPHRPRNDPTRAPTPDATPRTVSSVRCAYRCVVLRDLSMRATAVRSLCSIRAARSRRRRMELVGIACHRAAGFEQHSTIGSHRLKYMFLK